MSLQKNQPDVSIIYWKSNQDGTQVSESIQVPSNSLDAHKFKTGNPIGAFSTNAQTTFTDPLWNTKEAASRANSAVARRATGTRNS